MKFISGLFLNALLFLLSWVIPKKENTILCGGGMGERFSGNPKYFFLYLHRLTEQGEQPFHEYHWITKNYELYENLKTRGLPVLYGVGLKAFWTILRSEFLVIESGPAMGKYGHDIAYQRLFMGRFKIIQTWHGSGGKRILLDALRDRGFHTPLDYIYFFLEREELRNFRCILTMGERERGFMRQAFDNPNVFVLGYPKNDILVEGLDKWGYQKEWTRYKKVLLYAPTFRDKASPNVAFSKSFLEKLDDFLEDSDWVLLIKKHPFDKDLHIPKDLNRIKDVTSIYDDVQILLAQTDLLISDYSSISVDFLLTGNPILFYAYDYEFYREFSRRLHYDLLEDAPGPVCRTETELLDTLRHIDSITPSYTMIYRKNLEIFHHYTDGKSSERLLQCITKSL